MTTKTEETLKKKNATLKKELAVKNRELEIEAALEKVRSRSLAMHHSSELEHVVGALFDQLIDLGLSLDGALIFIFDKEKQSITHWVATTQLSAPVRIDLTYDKAVNQQKSQKLVSYEPTVSLTTKKSGNSVLITVSDNGNGIPKNIVDKIFQPFFTTKPTGSGTGLGLSLSYDIVKAHGGELKVETEEAEGSEFIIQLPV